MKEKYQSITDNELKKYCKSSNKIVSHLAQEVMRLREGIREHKSQTGHSLCWLNDLELWKLVDPEPKYPHETLPVQDEFLHNCRKYYESRVKGTAWEDPVPKKTITDK
jgi:hypothetical protein